MNLLFTSNSRDFERPATCTAPIVTSIDVALGDRQQLSERRRPMDASGALVFVEPGGDWPFAVEVAALDVVAFAQIRGERDEVMLARASERAARSSVEVVILACNSEHAALAVRRRTALAEALVPSIVESRHGRLVLSACEGASRALKRALLALASTLDESLVGSSTIVSVLIGGHVWSGDWSCQRALSPRLVKSW